MTLSEANLAAHSQSPINAQFLTLSNVPFGTGRDHVDLVLERFNVFAAEAEIIVNGENGEQTFLSPPDNTFYKGHMDGIPDSQAFIVFPANGQARGIISWNNDHWVLSNTSAVTGQSPAFLPAEEELVNSSNEFTCTSDDLHSQVSPLNRTFISQAEELSARAIDTEYDANIAIDTDYEFFQLFGNTTAALDYIGDLVGYSSTIYKDNINTNLIASHVQLWTTSNDPWTQNDGCALYEFGRY